MDWARKDLDTMMEELARVILQRLPEMKWLTATLADTVFVPKAILRQLALSIVLETCALTAREFVFIVRELRAQFSTEERLIRHLETLQCTCDTQDEWMDLAGKIDAIQGNDAWRSDAICPLYEADRINSRISEFVHLMRRRDVFDLMFTIRGGVARGRFGLMHGGLFTRALAGSKVLVETYHNVTCAALDFVCDTPLGRGDDPIPTDARLAFFNETRHEYGRTAIILSGGAAMGFYHLGVAKALIENQLMPRVLGGASAGSILCAVLGTRTDAECTRDLFNLRGTNAHGHYGRLKLDFFRPAVQAREPPHKAVEKPLEVDSSGGKVHDFLRKSQLFVPAALRRVTAFTFDFITGKLRPKNPLMNDTEHFRECVRISVGNFTFQEAFDRTGKVVNITVSPQNSSDPPRLLNYLTAPHVLVWSAAVASSSLPGVFEPNRLLVKDPDGTERFESAAAGSMAYEDGSMEADIPMEQLSEMFNVNHFIISQVNPHAIMFSSLGMNRSIWTNHLVGVFHGISIFLKDQVKAWIRQVVQLIGRRRLAPLYGTRRGFATQFFTQEYVGRETDITLNPWSEHRSLISSILNLLHNPTDEELLTWIKAAERVTWRHIPRLKSHCAVEMTLDKCVQRLRKRVLSESSRETKRIDGAVSATAHERMGSRVPSFFRSPSLLALTGGLNVSDQSDIHAWPSDYKTDRSQAEGSDEGLDELPAAHRPFQLNSGWGGLGLKGNHSASMVSLQSACSGLFIMDDSDDEKKVESAPNAFVGSPKGVGLTRKHSSLQDMEGDRNRYDGYVKTSNMANFYYRNSKSHDNLIGQSK